jgi:glycosyltransferase involved in cell wall biosynthesis
MRFAFVSTMGAGPWGGSEELWSRAAVRLHKEGHEVLASVLWWPTISPKITAMAEEGVKIDFRRGANKPSLPVRLARRVQRLYGHKHNDFAWLNEQKPDMAVIAQGGPGDGLEWMNYCRGTGTPYMSIVQCNMETWWPMDYANEMVSSAYREARKVFFVSQHNKRLLELQIGEALPRGEVVRNPINVPAKQPPAWPKENGTWNLACVARLEPSAKGQDVLLQILAQPKWRERPVKVNFFGGGDWEKNLKKLTSFLQVKNASFCGHVNDVRKIWEENHLLVLPSRQEGLPLALVEAMWCARPAVVTDVGGNAEVCEDGKTGFVAAASAVGALEPILEKAWERRNDWQSMGKSARTLVEELFPTDAVEDFCKKLTNV